MQYLPPKCSGVKVAKIKQTKKKLETLEQRNRVVWVVINGTWVNYWDLLRSASDSSESGRFYFELLQFCVSPAKGNVKFFSLLDAHGAQRFAACAAIKEFLSITKKKQMMAF